MENTLETDLKIIGDASLAAVNALPPNYFRKQGGYALKLTELQAHKARLHHVKTPEFVEFVLDTKRLIDGTIRFLRTGKDKHLDQAVKRSELVGEYYAELIAMSEEENGNGN